MGIVTEWDNSEKTIICHRFSGRWTSEELREAAEVAWDMIRRVDYRVDVILDVREGSRVPVRLLQQGRHIAVKRPPNAGAIIIVGASSLMQTMYAVSSKLYSYLNSSLSLSFVDTLEEAKALIAAQQQKAPAAKSAH